MFEGLVKISDKVYLATDGGATLIPVIENENGFFIEEGETQINVLEYNESAETIGHVFANIAEYNDVLTQNSIEPTSVPVTFPLKKVAFGLAGTALAMLLLKKVFK